jgi:hypothetical protein
LTSSPYVFILWLLLVPEVFRLTGLDNYNLKDQSRFNKRTGHLLKAFLSHLPFPVCLFAHNGNL